MFAWLRLTVERLQDMFLLRPGSWCGSSQGTSRRQPSTGAGERIKHIYKQNLLQIIHFNDSGGSEQVHSNYKLTSTDLD